MSRRRKAQAIQTEEKRADDRGPILRFVLIFLVCMGIFEVLWAPGARDFRNVGHKMIHVSQTYRSLKMLGDQLREPLIRAVVHGLLDGGPGESTASFDRCRERAHRVVGRDGDIVRFGDRCDLPHLQ